MKFKIGLRSKLSMLAVTAAGVILLFQNCSGKMQSLASGVIGAGGSSLSTPNGRVPVAPQALTGANPIRPLDIFPNGQSLQPAVTTTQTEVVPDTLDLAERAKWYLQGATQSLLADQDYAPGGPTIFTTSVPGEVVNYWETVGGVTTAKQRPVCWNVFPCIENDQVQNWGKVTLAMFLARRMSNYDYNNADGTLTAQLFSARAMVDSDANLRIMARGANPALQFLTYDREVPITPTTVLMESLIEMQRVDPSNTAREEAITELVARHQASLRAALNQNKTYYYFWNHKDDNLTSEQGYVRWEQAFIQGKALYALSRWRNFKNDNVSEILTTVLREYLLGWNNSEFWAPDDPSVHPQEAGQFVGQMHSHLVAVNGILESARPLKTTHPDQFAVYADFAKKVYEFVKIRNRMGQIGHFGEIGTTGDMIRLGLLLTELEIADEWEDIDAWTRNALSEGQIDDTVAQYIANNSGPSANWTNVGVKSKGLFLSDATHVFNFPLNKNFRYNVDGPSNAMRAMYEVWKKSIREENNFVAVNLLMNRSHRYFEVKSEVPYRGRVNIITRASIGAMTTLGVRIPDWGMTGLTVYENGRPMTKGTATSGEWYVLPAGSQFAIIRNVNPNSNYQIDFNLPVYYQSISTLRNDDQFWYEGVYPAPGGGAENIHTYQGSFRGNTLVDVNPRPAGGIPRYQRTSMLNFNEHSANPVPTKTVTRSPLAQE